MKELLCAKCGSSISGGMMFCPVCGAKPDPVLMEENARAKPDGGRGSNIKWGIVALVIFILLVTGVGLAIWPNAVIIGLQGRKSNVKSLINRIQATKMIADGDELEVILNEADINAYLKYVRTPKADIAFCRVELTPETIHNRIGKKIGPYKFFSIEFSPKISVDIWYKLVDGNLVITKSSVGHLPIIGQAKNLVAGKVNSMVFSEAEKNLYINKITNIEIEKQKLLITVKK